MSKDVARVKVLELLEQDKISTKEAVELLTAMQDLAGLVVDFGESDEFDDLSFNGFFEDYEESFEEKVCGFGEDVENFAKDSPAIQSLF